ncbi:MAG: alpha/beta hydrolase [Pseudomonadota bacterium]
MTDNPSTLRILQRPDGATLTYFLHRSAAHRAIVLLHGLASNASRWEEFAEHTRLRERWNLLRLNLRGHGEPVLRCRLDMETWCGDIAAVLAAEGHDQALLIGHSLGANVALHFAARYRERVQGLVLIDPVYPQALRGKLRWTRRFAPLLRVLAVLLLRLNALGICRGAMPRLDLRALDEEMRAVLAHHRAAIVRRYASPRADLRYFPLANYLQELAAITRPLPAAETITAPVLVLLSSGAAFCTPASVERIAQHYPHGHIVTIPAYHWPLTECPEQVRAAIEAWCAKLPDADTPVAQQGNN